MNIYVQPTFYQERPIPPRIRAAMEFITNCSQAFTSCEGEVRVRKLAPREQAAYDAAIEAVRLYFSGEMDFGDAPATPIAPAFTSDTPGPTVAGDAAPPPPPPAAG